jgi:hypothetical protein
MEPTLDDCNAALDEIEEMYDFGKDLRIRIMNSDEVLYLSLTWFKAQPPRGQRRLSAPRLVDGRVVEGRRRLLAYSFH